jgi:hypothetical protein
LSLRWLAREARPMISERPETLSRAVDEGVGMNCGQRDRIAVRDCTRRSHDATGTHVFPRGLP